MRLYRCRYFMKILLIILSAFSFSAFAYQESYRVSGFDDRGEPVIGTIYTNDEPLEVNGQLMDREGNTYDFYGRWNGRGEVTGQTEDGVDVALHTR